MIAFVVPTAAVTLLMALMFGIGTLIIGLGRLGQTGSLDYLYGHITRASAGNDAFDAAQAVVAPRLIVVGVVYLLGGALMLVSQNSNWIAALIIASALISIGLLLLTTVAARKALGIS